jgi:hypothetical protein
MLAGKSLDYDIALMQGGGRVRGCFFDSLDAESFIRDTLSKIASEAPFLFAVGDGNHSLAAAKAVWEEYKAAHSGDVGLMESPLRFALVEINNLYDKSLVFEPIHRVLFGISAETVLKEISCEAGLTAKPDGHKNGTVIEVSCKDDSLFVTVLVEPLVERLLDKNPASSVDYIHGDAELVALAEKGAVGLLLPPIRKESVFQTVALKGPLPRKSFSIGHSREKRYYLECRKLQ